MDVTSYVLELLDNNITNVSFIHQSIIIYDFYIRRHFGVLFIFFNEEPWFVVYSKRTNLKIDSLP